MLKCKPGDLAIIINGPNAGRLLEVLHQSKPYGPGWWHVKILGTPIAGMFGAIKITMTHGSIEDRRLRPIRDGDGEDEMLKIVGQPQPWNAHVHHGHTQIKKTTHTE